MCLWERFEEHRSTFFFGVKQPFLLVEVIWLATESRSASSEVYRAIDKRMQTYLSSFHSDGGSGKDKG